MLKDSSHMSNKSIEMKSKPADLFPMLSLKFELWTLLIFLFLYFRLYIFM